MTGMIRGQRKAVQLDGEALVRATFLEQRPGAVPRVFEPARDGVDLAGWAAGHREDIDRELEHFGAALFRGFGELTPAGFEAAAAGIVNDLYGDYGDLPRESASDKVFSSTPYPANLPIHFHNESSHMARWPMRICFYCAVAAPVGGETPLLDCRALCQVLDAGVVAELDAKGLTYVRNFGEGIDVAWQDFFRTGDRDEVERSCTGSGATCEWLPDGNLRIHQAARAVRTHPSTGERVFFNQILLHHPAALPDETRSALRSLYDPDSLPRNVTFGDGSPIPDTVVEHIMAVYDEHAIRFKWQAGDLIALDNMLCSHGRSVFSGPRKILVAMGRIVDAAALSR